MGEIIKVDEIVQELMRSLTDIRNKSGPVTLVSIQAGRAGDSEVYIEKQKQLAEKIGVDFCLCRLPEKAKQEEVITKIKDYNKDSNVKGIIINRPYPADWKPVEVFSAINPDKDIEGVSPGSLGKVFYGESGFISPTVSSVLAILEFLKIDLYGKETTIVGFSSLIGKPLALLLGQKFATVSITHIATYQKRKLEFYVKNADILITAVGEPNFIKAEWIKEKAVVIDVGISKKGKKVAGDVEFGKAVKKAAYITPVPGGVGRLTSLFLFKNLFRDYL